ncbi:MAG: 4Fe-4S binding protein [Chloroflexi bacterium]|nr:4Fe-4S binding protein [Chloroflexota bacterium]
MANDKSDQACRDSLLGRRAFVGLVGKAAVVVALGGFIRYVGPKDRLVEAPQGLARDRIIRPPGARPEEEFLSLCIRCDKCRVVCPYGLVSPVSITESIVSAGTPKLTGWCPNCRRCIPVCPTGALTRQRL